MTQPTAPGVFLPPISSVISSGTPDTIQFDSSISPLTTAQLTADGNWTSATAPANTPTQLVGVAKRASIILRCPADGLLFYLGVDNTLTAATGAPLYPGNRLDISGYIGPVWLLSSGVASTMFYRLL